jgi:hypothetical protein
MGVPPMLVKQVVPSKKLLAAQTNRSQKSFT